MNCRNCSSPLTLAEEEAGDQLCEVCQALVKLRTTLEKLGRVHPQLPGINNAGNFEGSGLPPSDL